MYIEYTFLYIFFTDLDRKRGCCVGAYLKRENQETRYY